MVIRTGKKRITNGTKVPFSISGSADYNHIVIYIYRILCTWPPPTLADNIDPISNHVVAQDAGWFGPLSLLLCAGGPVAAVMFYWALLQTTAAYNTWVKEILLFYIYFFKYSVHFRFQVLRFILHPPTHDVFYDVANSHQPTLTDMR